MSLIERDIVLVFKDRDGAKMTISPFNDGLILRLQDPAKGICLGSDKYELPAIVLHPEDIEKLIYEWSLMKDFRQSQIKPKM